MKKVYLDNAATTMLSGEVLQEMMPYFTDIYGNSSSLHSFGREAVAGVDKARDLVADSIGAKNSEIKKATKEIIINAIENKKHPRDLAQELVGL